MKKLFWKLGVAFLLVGVAATGLILWQANQSSMITYYVDTFNLCSWKDGHIDLSTAVNGPISQVKIKRQDVSKYLANAAKNHTCTSTDPNF